MINRSKTNDRSQLNFVLSFSSSRWKIRILGDMLVSFPAAILNLLVDPSPHLNALEFRLKNLARVENVIANPQLVTP